MPKPFKPKYNIDEQIYYTPDYGMRGIRGHIISVHRESNTATIKHRYGEEWVELDVPMHHLYTLDILQDW